MSLRFTFLAHGSPEPIVAGNPQVLGGGELK